MKPCAAGSAFRQRPQWAAGMAAPTPGFEYGLSAEWLELLKQVAPSLTRVAVLRDFRCRT